MAGPSTTRLPLVFAMATVAVACAHGTAPAGEVAQAPPAYEILIDARRAGQAEVRLTLPSAPARVTPARGSNGAGIRAVRCADGRPGVREGSAWVVPSGCTRLAWTVTMADLDAAGADASLPIAAYSRRHGYWPLPERDGLLRAGDDGGTATLRLRLEDGRTLERRYTFPSDNQPPFYGVIGVHPTHTYVSKGFTLRIFGAAPEYPWMDAIHDHVLASWSAWRRDLVGGPSPATIDWVWVQPVGDAEPGYNASAGAEAIVSQIMPRNGDPDGEAKARVVIATSAAHEGFHTVTGAAGQAWPAWVNESLASHYAIAAAREFLSAQDHRWLEAFYIEPQARAPLLDAQLRYSAGDGEQAQVFYTWGSRFWQEIEKVLRNSPNGSGRLAALIRDTNNFAGTNLNDADALATLLDRHSSGRARPTVRCFLTDESCSAGAPRAVSDR